MHYKHRGGIFPFSWLLDLICDSWQRYNNDSSRCISLWQENVGLSQIKCLPSEQIDSRFNKRLSILITRFSRFSKINYNSNRNLLRWANSTFCSPIHHHIETTQKCFQERIKTSWNKQTNKNGLFEHIKFLWVIRATIVLIKKQYRGQQTKIFCL